MKKWILPLLTAVLMVSACGVFSETPAEKREREAREAQQVVQNLETGNFSIQIDRMYPLRGSSKTVSGYSISVKDGKLISYLPFIGQAWKVPYGGGHGLNFTADILNYQVTPLRKEGYEVRIYVKTDEDEHVYILTIFDNGRTSADVQSGNRDRVSYSGIMEFSEE